MTEKPDIAAQYVDGPPKLPQLSAQPPVHVVQQVEANGQVGVPFEHTVALEGVHNPVIRVQLSTGVEPAHLLLRGTPTEAGDFAILVEGFDVHGVSTVRELQWTVVPNPRTMWTEQPSDSTARFHKLDTAALTLPTQEALLLGASKRGRTHARDGLHRDDDFAARRTDDGWLVCAVADGAGSAPYSRQGSHLAVEHVLGQLPRALSEAFGLGVNEVLEAFVQRGEAEGVRERLLDSLVSVCRSAAEELSRFAQVEGLDVRDLATTLVVVVARPVGQRWFAAGFAIGDGGAAVYADDGPVVDLLSHPEGGDYAGQTRFLAADEFTDEEVVAGRLRLWSGPRPDALLLMTDGVSDPWFPSDADWADPLCWQRLWADELIGGCDLSNAAGDAADQLLAWLDFYVPGYHDDRTIVLVIPKEG